MSISLYHKPSRVVLLLLLLAHHGVVVLSGWCSPNPCQNGAACSNGNPGSCSCTAEYKGTYCESCASGYVLQDAVCVPWCSTNPCAHGGTCNAPTSTCTCTSPYTAASLCNNCSTGYVLQDAVCVPWCSTNPCAHGGTCNAPTSTCTCTSPYTAASLCNNCSTGYTKVAGTGTCADLTVPTFTTCPLDTTMNHTDAVQYSTPIAVDIVDGSVTSTRLLGPPSGTASLTVGVHAVSYQALDAAGNRAFCNFTITVVDLTAPVFSFCPADITVSNVLSVSYATPTVADADVVILRTAGPASGAFFPAGTTQVVWTATDAHNNNSATCSFDVTVQDTLAPVLTCPSEVYEGASAPTVIPTYTITAVDNMAVPNMVTPSPAQYISSASSIASASFAAAQAFDGSLSTSWISAVGDRTGAWLEVVWNTGPATIRAFTVTQRPSSSYNNHINEVALHFPDGTQQTFTLLVTSSLVLTTTHQLNPPKTTTSVRLVVTAPRFQSSSAGVGLSELVFDYTDKGVTLLHTSGAQSGVAVPEGVYPTTYSAVDGSGNQATCTFNVTIDVVRCPWPIPAPLGLDPIADFSDCNSDAYRFPGSPQCWVRCPTGYRTYKGDGDDSTWPTQSYRCVWSDESHTAAHWALGCRSSSCSSRSVPINCTDNTKPVFADCSNPVILMSDWNGGDPFVIGDFIATWQAPTAVDVVDGNVAAVQHSGIANNSLVVAQQSYQVPPYVGYQIVGPILYNATDSKGNTGWCRFDIKYFDDVPPTYTYCPPNITQYSDVNYTRTEYTLPQARDKVWLNSNNRIAGPATYTALPPGNHSVIYRALDRNSNAAECTFNIEIIGVNECEEDPNLCQNGGTCEDLNVGYRCMCVPPFSGVNCEKPACNMNGRSYVYDNFEDPSTFSSDVLQVPFVLDGHSIKYNTLNTFASPSTVCGGINASGHFVANNTAAVARASGGPNTVYFLTKEFSIAAGSAFEFWLRVGQGQDTCRGCTRDCEFPRMSDVTVSFRREDVDAPDVFHTFATIGYQNAVSYNLSGAAGTTTSSGPLTPSQRLALRHGFQLFSAFIPPEAASLRTRLRISHTHNMNTYLSTATYPRVELALDRLRLSCQALHPCTDDNAAGLCQHDSTPYEDKFECMCNCTVGYRGRYCEEEIPDCDWQTDAIGPAGTSELCVHGLCVDTEPFDNSFGCNCSGSGYNGSLCEQDIDECTLSPISPCLNGATCVNTNGSFYCVCVPGFRGERCEIEIPDCEDGSLAQGPLNGSCQHGGGCVDGVPFDNTYTCNCTGTGWTGQNCELPENDCKSDSCLHGGNCTDLFKDFNCTCPPAWQGKRCDILKPHCLKNVSLFMGAQNYYNTTTEGDKIQVQCSTSYSSTADFPDLNKTLLLVGDTCTISCDSTAGAAIGRSTFQCNANGDWTGTPMGRCVPAPCLATTFDAYGLGMEACAVVAPNTSCSFDSCQENFQLSGGQEVACTEPGRAFISRCRALPDCNNSVASGPHSRPCYHGECHNGISPRNAKYECRCAHVNRTGDNCEHRMPTALSVCIQEEPCQHDGFCVDGEEEGNYTCHCTEEWAGANCSEPVDVCASWTCVHGGTCTANVSAGNTPSCSCPEGTAGPHCDLITDMCSAYELCGSVADNNCTSRGSSFSCECTVPWWGPGCRMDATQAPAYTVHVAYTGSLSPSTATTMATAVLKARIVELLAIDAYRVEVLISSQTATSASTGTSTGTGATSGDTLIGIQITVSPWQTGEAWDSLSPEEWAQRVYQSMSSSGSLYTALANYSQSFDNNTSSAPAATTIAVATDLAHSLSAANLKSLVLTSAVPAKPCPIAQASTAPSLFDSRYTAEGVSVVVGRTDGHAVLHLTAGGHRVFLYIWCDDPYACAGSNQSLTPTATAASGMGETKDCDWTLGYNCYANDFFSTRVNLLESGGTVSFAPLPTQGRVHVRALPIISPKFSGPRYIGGSVDMRQLRSDGVASTGWGFSAVTQQRCSGSDVGAAGCELTVDLSCAHVPAVDPCAEQPCGAHGLCASSPGGYSCVCSSGWMGQNCTVDVDDCASFPCVHGQCTDVGTNAFNCSCAAGWTGPLCSEDVDDCGSPSPCLNGGVCSDTGTNAYKCACAAAWAGKNCELNATDCATCNSSHGVCTFDATSGYGCQCDSGWTGETCSEDEDDCASFPCVHGQCTDVGTNAFNCSCAAGWTGPLCSEDVDDCGSPSPCLNGGVCSDTGTNSFHCTCPVGFVGVTCSQPSNPANSDDAADSSEGSSTGAVAGGVAAAVVLVAAAAGAAFWWRKKQQSASTAPTRLNESDDSDNEQAPDAPTPVNVSGHTSVPRRRGSGIYTGDVAIQMSQGSSGNPLALSPCREDEQEQGGAEDGDTATATAAESNSTKPGMERYPSSELPEHWHKVEDSKTGVPYFYDGATGQSQWEPPLKP